MRFLASITHQHDVGDEVGVEVLDVEAVHGDRLAQLLPLLPRHNPRVAGERMDAVSHGRVPRRHPAPAQHRTGGWSSHRRPPARLESYGEEGARVQKSAKRTCWGSLRACVRRKFVHRVHVGRVASYVKRIRLHEYSRNATSYS